MPSSSYGKCTQCSVISCNVSFRREIDSKTLVGILSRRIPIGEWKPHMMVFFNELPHSIIQGVMQENSLTLEQLTLVFEAFPKIFQEKNFKKFRQAKLNG